MEFQSIHFDDHRLVDDIASVITVHELGTHNILRALTQSSVSLELGNLLNLFNIKMKLQCYKMVQSNYGCGYVLSVDL